MTNRIASIKRLFRTLLLLLVMMTVGVNGAWAETINFNLPNGYYYIGNEAGDNGVPKYDSSNFEANFYMCPASGTVNEQNYLGSDESKPLITTLKSFEAKSKTYSYAVWYIEAATGDNAGYFYIKHRDTGKYMVANDNTAPAATRRRVNLGPTSNPGNDGLFRIQSDDNGITYYISSKTKSSGNNKYLTPSNGNKDYLNATSSNEDTGGIIGFYTAIIKNSAWHFVQVKCSTPTISGDSNGLITITCSEPAEGATIYYSTDGITIPSSSTQYEEPFMVAGQTTIKAIATKSGYVDSEMASSKLVLNPTVTLAENEYTYDGSAKEPAVSSVKDGETVISSDEYRIEYQDNVNAGSASVLVKNKTGGNYIVYGSATFTIHPKAVTIIANDASKPYDGTALTEDGFTNTALETDDTHTFTVVMTEESAITNVGSQPNVIETVDGVAVTTGTETAVGNYLVTTANGTLVVNQKNIGDGTLTDGFTLSLDEDNNIVITYDATGRTLELSTDYTIGSESTSGKYSTRTILGAGNYSGSFSVKNAIAHFTTDADQAEWSATFVAESSDVADIGHVLPEGISAFIISGIQGEWAIPEPLNYIPAGVPVLLVSHEEKNGFFVMDAHSDDVTLITEGQKTYNKLKEVTEESVHFNNREIYLLYKNEFVLNKDGDLGEGKVYVENPNYHDPSSAPARLSIAWGNVTGIGAVLNDNGEMRNDNWYTLDGRKLIGKPTTKGLYIVGGKKIVIK